MLPAFIAIPDFFAEARAMRAAFDAHFADPMRHNADIHQVWNYWNVPGQYTYLRTQPEKIIPRALCDQFLATLLRVAIDRFGMTGVTWPYLSLYVAGCSQNMHNDSRNGRLGFVFSLTDWENRRFAGGETMIFRDQRYFGSETMTQAQAATNFFDLVPCPFNQLLLFDDRIPHAVPRIEGTMEPRDGRVVLHGHVVEGAALAVGALPIAIARAVIAGHIQAIAPKLVDLGHGLAGVLTMRVMVRPDGQIEGGQILYDRLLAVADGAAEPKDAINAAIELIRPIRFPATAGTSAVTFGIPFGPSLGA